MKSRKVTLEVCCGDINSVIAARAGGAGRIELCSALSEGGLTPSNALIREAVSNGFEEVNVLVRPRSGDFHYNALEVGIMEAEIIDAVYAGATGIVIGALTPDGEVDMSTMRRLIDVARTAGEGFGRKINITFHRAFDVAADPFRALEDVIELGCDTLLTSGMADVVTNNLPLIRRLVSVADGRITIMAGSGINISNVLHVIEATGVTAVHASVRAESHSWMKFRRENVRIGSSGPDDYVLMLTSPVLVCDFISVLP